MTLSVIFGIIVAVCLVSSLIFYVFAYSRDKLKSSSTTSINERQQIIYSLRPSIDIITKKLSTDFSFRTSVSSCKSNRSSTTINGNDESDTDRRKYHKSLNSLSSVSIATNFSQPYRVSRSNWRQGSIFDPNQMAMIPFSLPINNNSNNNNNNTINNKYRRRSVAICNSIVDGRDNLINNGDFTLPCLLSFSIVYLNKSQIKIQFHSLQSLPSNIQLQQLTIKAKLLPDGKEKSIQTRKMIHNNIKFDDDNNQYVILFSNMSFEKMRDRSLFMTIYGKDQNKKTISFGHIGKINLTQINNIDGENRIDFTHAIEKSKQSSIELFMSLEKHDDQHIHVEIQRIKGLKIDQKKFDATCYLQVLLLDRHRPLAKKETKIYRLKSSNFIIGEEYNFNILTYNSNNLERLMIMVNLFTNSNVTNEYKCTANIKLGSPLLCSGSGTVHWQQFKIRESFSMWHTLNKEQH